MLNNNEYCISYAYPTSATACKHDMGSTGCYLVTARERDVSTYKAFMEYFSAFCYAKSFEGFTANIWCISNTKMHSRLIPSLDRSAMGFMSESEAREFYKLNREDYV